MIEEFIRPVKSFKTFERIDCFINIEDFYKKYTDFIKSLNKTSCIKKVYNNEKAIISLTSWKKRINGVGKTIYSLIKNHPDFHIVLVLSKEEFIDENSLPENLRLIVNNGYIELLWVEKNYKSFKKILFTMDKYRSVPVISADDDCIYKYNYAEELYQTWYKHRNCFITYNITKRNNKYIETWGYATLHPPYVYGQYGLKYLKLLDINNNKCTQDDLYYACLRTKINNNRIINLNKKLKDVVYLHTEENSLYNIRKKMNNGNREFRTYLEIMKLHE